MCQTKRLGIRVLFILLALGSSPYGVVPAWSLSDREHQELKSAVRSVKIEVGRSSRDSGKLVEGQRRPLSYTVFDEKGNVVEVTMYGHDGSRSTIRWLNVYDEKGRLHEVRVAAADAGDPLVDRTVYIYDNAGRQKEKRRLGPDGDLQDMEVYVYDNRGQVSERFEYSSDGALSTREVYTYDAAGLLKEERVYDPTGERMRRMGHKYTADGKRSETIMFAPDDSIWSRSVYTYSDQPSHYEITYYDHDAQAPKSKEVRSYEYDSEGNWIKEVTERVSADPAVPASIGVSYRTITYYSSVRR